MARPGWPTNECTPSRHPLPIGMGSGLASTNSWRPQNLGYHTRYQQGSSTSAQYFPRRAHHPTGTAAIHGPLWYFFSAFLLIILLMHCRTYSDQARDCCICASTGWPSGRRGIQDGRRGCTHCSSGQWVRPLHLYVVQIFLMTVKFEDTICGTRS